MSRKNWTWTIEKEYPSRLGVHHLVLDRLTHELHRLGWCDCDIFGVQLAIEESMTNAIRHGNGQDESKRVFFRCKVNAEELWAEVCDEGPGFNPDTMPDPTLPENLEVPGGRGLMLIRAYMTDVRHNDAGNCVTMVKHTSHAAKDCDV